MHAKVYDRTWYGGAFYDNNIRWYGMLKSLSFNPETDITLSSLPACEFSVEIIITDGREIEQGEYIQLYDEKNTLYADYYVVKVERISDTVVRVLAQSELALMDKWVLKAQRITDNASISAWLTDFMVTSRYVKSGKQRRIKFLYQNGIGDIKLDGFFPEQTMRERLQQICFAYGITVQQWFCTGLTLSRITDVGQIPPIGSDLIPASDTFFRPERQNVEAAGSFAVYSYTQWTVVKPETMGKWDKEVTDDVNNTTWYCSIRDGYEELNEDNDEGKPVEISDIMIINGNNVLDVYERKWRFFIGEEYIIDVVNNGQYYPNMPVRFYYNNGYDLSNSTIIEGIITKCDFTFGVQNRSKLTIARIPGDSDKPVYRVRVHYVYPYTVDDGEGGETDKTLALGRNDYYAPTEAFVSFDLPTIYVDVVGDTLAFVPDTDSPYTTGIYVNDHDEELTINYKREAS